MDDKRFFNRNEIELLQLYMFLKFFVYVLSIVYVLYIYF